MGVGVEFQRMLNITLTGAGLTVYDFAPQSSDGGSSVAFPYVEIGWTNLGEWDTATEAGFDVLARIHTRTRNGTASECKAIQAQIYSVMHRTELAITGQQNILMIREMSDCLREPDGTFHGVCEYRALLRSN